MADFGIGEALAAIGLGSGAAAGTGVGLATGVADLAATAGAGVGALTGVGDLAAVAAPAASFTLPSLGTIGTVASVAGTALSAKAGLTNAQYQEEVEESNAQALTAKADQDTAAGEQTEIARQRQTQLALSRDQAFAAGSGGSATSPTTLDIEGQVAQQGTYNALSGLYAGQSAARSDAQQAAIDLFQAKNIGNAAPVAAAGTILSGLSSFVNNRARLNYFTTTGDGAQLSA